LFEECSKKEEKEKGEVIISLLKVSKEAPAL